MHSEIENPMDFVEFVLLSEYRNRAGSSFVLNYTNKEDGEQVVHKGPNGSPLRLKFHKGRRMLRYPIKSKLVELLRNHPECYGSKNCEKKVIDGKTFYPNALFKEVKENSDAKIAVDATRIRTEAMNLVFEVMEDENKASDLAAVLGIKSSGSISDSKLLLYAENNPQEMIDTIKSPEFKAKAVAKRAIELDVLQREGIVYCVGDIQFGTEFDDIVKSIIDDKDKFELLEKKLGTIK